MNFMIAGNNLVNDSNAITNFIPRIRGLYSANPEEPLRAAPRGNARRCTAAGYCLACGAAGPVEP